MLSLIRSFFFSKVESEGKFWGGNGSEGDDGEFDGLKILGFFSLEMWRVKGGVIKGYKIMKIKENRNMGLFT